MDNKSTIAREHFKRNTVSSCTGMVLISMNDMSGIEPPDESRFQRMGTGRPNSLGRCPMADSDTAPPALNASIDDYV